MGHNLQKNIGAYKDAHILKREVIKSGLSKAGSNIIGGFNPSTVPEQFGKLKSNPDGDFSVTKSLLNLDNEKLGGNLTDRVRFPRISAVQSKHLNE